MAWAYLSDEPVGLEWPEAGEGVEEKRVGMGCVGTFEDSAHVCDSETY